MRKEVRPRFDLLLLPVIDRLLIKIYHIKPLRADGSSIISLEFRRYKGHPITLDDGSEVKAGNTIIELHLNSAWFRKRRKFSIATSHLSWEVLHYLKKDLSLLAEQIANGTLDKITALHGSTLLHIGARRLGFQVKELPNTLWKKLTRSYLAGLMQIHHLRGLKDIGEPPELKEVWLSTAELLGRYGPKHC